jgi:hypothetical protein
VRAHGQIVPIKDTRSFFFEDFSCSKDMEISLTIATILCCILLPAVNGAGSDFYPHGVLDNDDVLQRSTGPEPSYYTLLLTQATRFYGNLYSSITVRILLIYNYIVWCSMSAATGW